MDKGSFTTKMEISMKENLSWTRENQTMQKSYLQMGHLSQENLKMIRSEEMESTLINNSTGMKMKKEEVILKTAV